MNQSQVSDGSMDQNDIQKTAVKPIIQPGKKQIIDILIPAHNEETHLEVTINSLRESFRQAGRNCRIIVGLDACTDNSKLIAVRCADIVVPLDFHSKWKTINYLLKFVNSEWIAFVDVGALWPENMFQVFEQFENDNELLFVAPSYQMRTSSILQKLNWWLESRLKSIENKAGGPITVHGSTIFYKVPILLNVLKTLSYRDWLNDDVIIPLTMRALYPKMRGLYLADTPIIDLPPVRLKSNRRLRMSIGNFEVVEFLEQKIIKVPKLISLLWFRRHIRIYWAYFILMFLILFLVSSPFDQRLNFSISLVLFLICMTKRVFRVSLKSLFYRIESKSSTLGNEIKTNVKWH